MMTRGKLRARAGGGEPKLVGTPSREEFPKSEKRPFTWKYIKSAHNNGGGEEMRSGFHGGGRAKHRGFPGRVGRGKP